MYIKKKNTLTSYEIHCINGLIARCADTDGFIPPVFTGDDGDVQNFPCFFLVYDCDKPFAFFSVFSADNRECEIYGVLPREYRTGDIFDKIIRSICRTIKSYLTSVTKILYVNDVRNMFFKSMLEKDGVKTCSSTYLMKLSDIKNPPYDISRTKIPGINLRDIYVRIEKDKKSNIVKFRLMYGIFRGHFGKEIGHCLCSVYEHADNSVNTQKITSLCIHDVLIDKSYRNRGLGTFLVRYAINRLNRHTPVQSVILNADAYNKAAVQLYLNSGFKIIQQLDYYTIYADNDAEIS